MMCGPSEKTESRDIKWVAVLFRAGNFIPFRVTTIKLLNLSFSSILYGKWISHSFT